jgi:drug/metabolite transporter (DMT)-like permease
MLAGIISGLAAGALWGLTFVAPRAVQPYGEVDLAILRYGIFGLTSMALMAVHARFRPGRLTWGRTLRAIWLGLSGFVVYYVCVAFSVSLAGPAIAPLVIGALPVLLARYGNWRERAAGWGAIAAPLTLMAAGLVVVNVDTMRGATAPTDQARGYCWALDSPFSALRSGSSTPSRTHASCAPPMRRDRLPGRACRASAHYWERCLSP